MVTTAAHKLFSHAPARFAILVVVGALVLARCSAYTVTK